MTEFPLKIDMWCLRPDTDLRDCAASAPSPAAHMPEYADSKNHQLREKNGNVQSSLLFIFVLFGLLDSVPDFG